MSDVLARRYAAACFELAQEAGDAAGWGARLAAAAAGLGDPEVARTLTNPRITMADRVALTQSVAPGTSQPVANLLRLLMERGRIGLLPDIVTAYRRLADRAGGLVHAEVTTAVPVDEQMVGSIRRSLIERLGCDVQTEVRQDAGILGGLVVRIGDRVIDNSVRTQLQRLQAHLV